MDLLCLLVKHLQEEEHNKGHVSNKTTCIKTADQCCSGIHHQTFVFQTNTSLVCISVLGFKNKENTTHGHSFSFCWVVTDADLVLVHVARRGAAGTGLHLLLRRRPTALQTSILVCVWSSRGVAPLYRCFHTGLHFIRLARSCYQGRKKIHE